MVAFWHSCAASIVALTVFTHKFPFSMLFTHTPGQINDNKTGLFRHLMCLETHKEVGVRESQDFGIAVEVAILKVETHFKSCIHHHADVGATDS